MQDSYKVLIVDDDLRLRSLLERYLTEQGFQIRTAANSDQMDRLLTRESIHLIVLDLMLPGEDGLSICRRLRSQNNPIPIIMVTAKGEEVDRIVGLEIGADDYISKPFNPRELLARIRAVLRRQANELREHLHKIMRLSHLVNLSLTSVRGKCSTKINICL